MRPILLITSCLLLLAPIAASAQPTTRPSEARPGADRPRPNADGSAARLERMREAIDSLQLTDAQRTAIKADVDAAREQIREKFQAARDSGDRETLRTEVRQILDTLREKVGGELTDAQRQELAAKLRADGPPTAGAADGPQGGPRAGQRIRQLEAALETLNLTDDQKAQVKPIVEDLRNQLQALRDNPDGDRDAMREKAREAFTAAREKIVSILTVEQRQQLREEMQNNGPGPNGPGGADSPPPDGGKDRKVDITQPNTTPEKSGVLSSMASSSTGPSTRASSSTAPSDPSELRIGESPPALNLELLSGRPFSLVALKGKPAVLIFGSYSLPNFRDRAPALDDLRQSVGSRATFVLIYTREARAKGEWDIDRNQQDKVLIEQTTTMDARRKVAKEARERLKFAAWTIAIDTIENDALQAYGHRINGAVVIARDGTISAIQDWAEPYALKRMIDEALTAK